VVFNHDCEALVGRVHGDSFGNVITNLKPEETHGLWIEFIDTSKMRNIILSYPESSLEAFELAEDLELMIILSNAGEVDLRKGVTFRIRILVNNQKIQNSSESSAAS
jgi:S-adenosylmethionine hydrolase